MWQELADSQELWIGGTLIDYGDAADRRLLGVEPAKTKIIGIRFAHGKWFEVVGENFSCGGDRSVLGLTGNSSFPKPGNGLMFRGYGGHEWHIEKPQQRED